MVVCTFYFISNQRWIYRVDYTRTNEFGQQGEPGLDPALETEPGQGLETEPGQGLELDPALKTELEPVTVPVTVIEPGTERGGGAKAINQSTTTTATTTAAADTKKNTAHDSSAVMTEID